MSVERQMLSTWTFHQLLHLMPDYRPSPESKLRIKQTLKLVDVLTQQCFSCLQEDIGGTLPGFLFKLLMQCVWSHCSDDDDGYISVFGGGGGRPAGCVCSSRRFLNISLVFVCRFVTSSSLKTHRSDNLLNRSFLSGLQMLSFAEEGLFSQPVTNLQTHAMNDDTRLGSRISGQS